jgi:hypothetical protein
MNEGRQKAPTCGYVGFRMRPNVPSGSALGERLSPKTH